MDESKVKCTSGTIYVDFLFYLLLVDSDVKLFRKNFMNLFLTW